MSITLFSSLALPPPADNDSSSILFSHLQSTLVGALASPTAISMAKLDTLLLEAYLLHCNMVKSQYEGLQNTRTMIKDCEVMMEECRVDKEQIMKTKLERRDLMTQLRTSIEERLKLLEEKERMQSTIGTMQELNDLLVQKNSYLEEQISAMKAEETSIQSMNSLSLQLNALQSNHSTIQTALVSLTDKTHLLDEIIEPLTILGQACVKNPQLKEIIWKTIESGDKEKWMQCDFIGISKKLKQ